MRGRRREASGPTARERAALARSFTSAGGPVFAITAASQADRGALMSRYSRTDRGMRRVFLDEFAGDGGRGGRFYERVLAGYGDDSVAELGFAQLAIEGVSNIAAKAIEDRRIGLSYLEKSSRYVAWDRKERGRYRYYRDPAIMSSRHADAYVSACDAAFETYSRWVGPVTAYVREQCPLSSRSFARRGGGRAPYSRLRGADADAAEAAWRASTRARALDALRGLLPASTLTNVGVAGNGRAFEHMLVCLAASGLEEERRVAARAKAELRKVIGPLISRVDGPHGAAMVAYRRASLARARALARAEGPGPRRHRRRVRLAECEPERAALDRVVAALVYEGSPGAAFSEVAAAVRRMPRARKERAVAAAAAARGGRRQRPPRAFEMTQYTFDMVNNFGMFRDMHRHRVLTMERQLLTADHGYSVPADAAGAGMAAEWAECMDASRGAFSAMRGAMPEQAQYAVSFAYNYQYVMRCNLREAAHIIELRTSPQGHEDYRLVAQEMLARIRARHPALSRIVRFADEGGPGAGRLAAEERAARRLRGAA